MEGMMFVRRAGGADVPAMFRIYNNNLDDYFAPENIEFFMLQWPRGQLVAESVTGCIAVSLSSYLMEDGTASIALLAVDAPFRRMGAGKALINHLKTECWASGIRRIQLEARIGNVSAISLYESLGFRKTVILPSLYSNGGDGIRMVLDFNRV